MNYIYLTGLPKGIRYQSALFYDLVTSIKKYYTKSKKVFISPSFGTATVTFASARDAELNANFHTWTYKWKSTTCVITCNPDAKVIGNIVIHGRPTLSKIRESYIIPDRPLLFMSKCSFMN